MVFLVKFFVVRTAKRNTKKKEPPVRAQSKEQKIVEKEAKSKV